MKLRTTTMKENSCKDCQDRYIGCHSNCEKYKEWKAKKNEEKEKIKLGWLKRNNGYYHK